MPSDAARRPGARLFRGMKTTLAMNARNTIGAAGLLALASATTASAQAVITANGLFAIGSRYQLATDEAPAVTPGSNGTALSWSFTGLQADNSSSMEVMEAGESPFGIQLPGDRAAVEDTDASAEYISVSPTQLLGHGRIFQENGVQVPVALDPPMVLLNLPAQYNQVHSGVSRSQVTHYIGLDLGLGFTVDSMRVRTRIAYQS